eukprot:TRINITY_DN192_c0_g1_i1.p1 TRINITY_DN192_c0_g1~~TRINITY_DN192_c0_g1_i1.p1  ORF type:complete len:185 (+),score=43.25 TRINITY_DN192_c0_g1_i1:73-627(+)
MAHVVLNVCGMKYEVLVATLLNSPETMLGGLVDKWNETGEFSDSSATTREIFIDRNGERFQYILDWYRDGKIVLPPHVSYEAFLSDLQFFGLPTDAVQSPSRNQLCVVSSINGRCYIEGAVVPGTDTLHRSIWGCPVVDNSMTPFPVLSALASDNWHLSHTHEISGGTSPQAPDKVVQYFFGRK